MSIDYSLKVLVVDDMALMRKVMTKALLDMGFKEVEQADHGAQAWEMLEKAEKPFGLVVSDWNMPVMNGLELLKRVRAYDKMKDVPFVICTLESERNHVVQAVKAGVNQYVIKPFTQETFVEKLGSVFAPKK